MKTYVLKTIIMFITIISFSCESKNIQPNIILVLVDDQGWTDSSVRMMKERDDSKSDFYETPNMERMANEGLVFSSAYAPAPVLSPTDQFLGVPALIPALPVVLSTNQLVNILRCFDASTLPSTSFCKL